METRRLKIREPVGGNLEVSLALKIQGIISRVVTFIDMGEL